METIYDYTVKDREGNDVSLKDYEGKTLFQMELYKVFSK